MDGYLRGRGGGGGGGVIMIEFMCVRISHMTVFTLRAGSCTLLGVLCACSIQFVTTTNPWHCAQLWGVWSNINIRYCAKAWTLSASLIVSHTWSAKLKLALIFKFTFINYFQVCQAVNDQYTICTLRNNVQEFSYRKLGQSNCPPRRWSHSKKCELRQVRLASAACACRTCWQPTRAVDACVVASIWAWCSVCVYLHLVPYTSTVQIHRKRDDLFLPVFLQAPCMKVVPKFCCWCWQDPPSASWYGLHIGLAFLTSWRSQQ